MPDLKPCPFCGSPATFGASFGAWNISCEKCPADMLVSMGWGDDYEPSRERAAGIWNRRWFESTQWQTQEKP